MLYALSKDPQFAESIVRAAECHKEYWTSTEELSCDWDGFLSIPLLGAAALAYDRQIPFRVDCDYVPMRLVSGNIC